MVAPPPSKLDQRQILQAVLDESTGRLRTDTIATISDIAVSIDLDPTDDGVYIADKTGNELNINADGSLDVKLTSNPISSKYFSVDGVVTGVTASIINTTVLSNGVLQKIVFSGSNIAEYELIIDGITEDKQRTYFGSPLNGEFNFNQGLPLTVGQTLVVTVIHNRPDVGDFNARIQFMEA